MVANGDEYAVVTWFTVGAAHGPLEPRAGARIPNCAYGFSADLNTSVHNYIAV